MAHWISSCLLLMFITSLCHGYPAFGKFNLNAGVDTNFKANSKFSYNSGKEGDKGVNINAGLGGDWFAALGLDGGFLVGDNGQGARGVAVAAKAASKTGANILGGINSNFHDRTINSGFDFGAGVSKAIGGNAGFFWPNPREDRPEQNQREYRNYEQKYYY